MCMEKNVYLYIYVHFWSICIYECICTIVLMYAYVYTEIISRYAHNYAYIYKRMF